VRFSHILTWLACLFLISCSSINKYFGLQDDNMVEEVTEDVIETAVQIETGYRPNIDLTPSSPE
jgi:hypothetical protein